MSDQAYLPRLADRLLPDLLSELPAVLLTGPRATGKTTTARRHASTIVRLDVEAEARAFEADPDAALRAMQTPVLLDEWQSVPGVLGAVKRAVDDGSGAGRFLLTGSVRADLQAQTWPGTGRVIRVPMYGLTMQEMLRRAAEETFIERLAHADLDAFPVPEDPPDLLGYVALATRGGFPEPALLSPAARSTWLQSYVEQLLTRDVEPLGGSRDPGLLRRYFEALCLNSAGVAHDKTLYDAAGIDRKTASAYERLLTNLLVVDAVPAWSTNRLSRLSKAAKRFIVDPSLLTAGLRLDDASVLRDGDLLGRVLETFVLSQIRPEAELSTLKPRLHHLRTRDGAHEVDLIVELARGDVLGVEIKASAAPVPSDARHLDWLRTQLGDRFLAGAVLHTGPRPFRLAERVFALPIAALWS
jgi:predicted AAA+ superfamily ATPase